MSRESPLADHAKSPRSLPAAGSARTARAAVRALRPKQWTKNLLVFIGLLFSLNAGQPRLVLATMLAFCVFCALSSAGYLVNDLADAEADRLHPTKRHRPIASGELDRRVAIVLAAALALGGFAGAAVLGPAFFGVAVLYVCLTASYSLGLKHVVLIDVFMIAAGFVLRAVAGALAIAVPISPWLYVCTGLAALFIALSKRRSELSLLAGGAATHRKNLEHYSLELLDQLSVVVLSVTVMAYTLYTFSAENLPANHLMMLTVPVVLYGLFRYLYLVQTQGRGGSPEDMLLFDKPLLATAVVWLALSALIIYVF